MRKVYYFLTLILSLGYFGASAQYFQISHTAGLAVVGGVNVTVTPLNGPNVGNFCGTGPYQIGKDNSNGYRYDFGTPVTQVRFEMTRIHDDDTIQFQINSGSGYNVVNLTVGNLSPFAGTCAQTTTGMTVAGGLSTTGGATGPGQGVTVDLSATPLQINSVIVTHIRHAANNIASDVYYNAYFQDDSCSLGFVATADSPACAGRNVQLNATNFANTTYAWTTNGVFQQPNWSPSSTVHNPTLLSVNQAQSGQYIVTATRGACVYKDTVQLSVYQSPSRGTPMQTGPVCPNFDDTIYLDNPNLPIGGWAVAFGAWGRDTLDPNLNYSKIIKSVQASQANDIYNMYVVDIQGCYSDTAVFIFKVHEDVTAAFTWDIKEGCDEDTVTFKNLSMSDGGLNFSSVWDFGDNSAPLSIRDTVHYYTVPKPNYSQRDYNVELAVANLHCFDTATQLLSINHPVKAEYQYDDDSICQGATINFIAGDSSYVKPGTIPKMLWTFGDGATDTIFDPSHTYDLAGMYYPTFTITDFLGCSDSFKLPLVVDSNGFVAFQTDKESVCVGEEITFTGQYSEYGYVSAIWNFADGVEIPDSTLVYHSYNEPGTYDVFFDIVYRICPNASFNAEYEVKPIPQVYLGEDTTICPNGESIFIQDMSNLNQQDKIKYSWNTPTKDVSPGIYVHHHGTYSVTADLDGCTASDTLVVSKNCYIDIPNVFTPNGDGTSDYFLPRQMLSRSVSTFDMQIYNRWGEKVFETSVPDGRGWDGKYGGEAQPTGVYVYLIQVTFANGVSERYQGNVTLLR